MQLKLLYVPLCIDTRLMLCFRGLRQVICALEYRIKLDTLT